MNEQMNISGSLLYGKLYGESDTAIIFFNFNCLVTGNWDLKSKIPSGDPQTNCPKIWVYCIQNDRTEHATEQKNWQPPKL